MTETDTSREEMLPIPSPEQCASNLRDDGFHPEATCVERLMREASYHQQEIDTLVNRIRQEQARAEKAEAERDTAWNDAIEAAAHECEQVAYSGKYPQVDQIELGCLRCRDSIRALRKGVTP